ncbi:hypothetical protein KIN20_037081, partial [Parelaphostrongylus tenuis]
LLMLPVRSKKSCRVLGSVESHTTRITKGQYKMDIPKLMKLSGSNSATRRKLRPTTVENIRLPSVE